MRKPADLRAYLTRCNAFLTANPDRLHVFVEKGRIVCTGTRNLSHEYLYTLTLVVTDYPASEDEIMLPLLGWLRVNQPELFENPARWDTAFQFEVELLNNDAVDIEIQLALTERVIVQTGPDGKQLAQHVGEPAHPDIPAEDTAIDVVLPEGLGTVEVRVPAWRHPYDDDFQAIEEWAAGLLARLKPAERRRVNRAVAVELRRNESQRIASQQAPDGSPFAPRRAPKNLRGKKGQVRRKMFARLRTAQHMRIEATDTEAVVGYTGRSARIALIHQEGRTDRPARGQPAVRYPRRRLIGFTQTSRDRVLDTLAQHLAGRKL